MVSAGKLPVYFDGEDLTTYFKVNYSWSVMPQTEAYLDEAKGRDGGIFLGYRLMPRNIPLMLKLDVQTLAEAKQAISWLAGVLYKDSPVPVVFPHMPDVTFYGVWSGESSLSNVQTNGRLEGTVMCPDPVGYGALRTVQVASGATADFEVGGNYPTYISVEALAAASGTYRLTSDEGQSIAFELEAGQTVAADGDTRVCRVDGVTALPTLDSDWVRLSPGSRWLQNNVGDGSATVTFRERWL